MNYKPTALALSIQALSVAAQAALGTVLGLGAESLGEHIRSRDNKK